MMFGFRQLANQLIRWHMQYTRAIYARKQYFTLYIRCHAIISNHWGSVTHMCVIKLGNHRRRCWDNDLQPVQYQTIICNKGGVLWHFDLNLNWVQLTNSDLNQNMHDKLHGDVEPWKFAPSRTTMFGFMQISNDLTYLRHIQNTQECNISHDIYVFGAMQTFTHCGRVTYISMRQAIVGADNVLSPLPHQVVIWTKGGLLLIGAPGTNSSGPFY